MKRDMDLVRRILLVLEQRPARDYSPVKVEEVEAADQPTLNEHLLLLLDAGMIEGEPLTSVLHDPAEPFGSIGWDMTRLTWAGHDFIAAAMNDTVWNAAKKQAGDMFRSLSVSTLSALLQLIMRQQLGLP